jgi:hypothetical protein
MATKHSDDHDRSAAGMDYDSPIKEKAAHLGHAVAENGPEVLFEEIEKLLPESWREHIQTFPIAAMLLGVGAGLFLGMRKGDEVIAAGSAMLTSAAMSNISTVMDRATGS